MSPSVSLSDPKWTPWIPSLLQRLREGEAVLHGAVVSPPAGEPQLRWPSAVALIGPSGSGKSTVARRLVLQGWTLLADDLSTLRLSAEPTAAPDPGVGIEPEEVGPGVQWCADFLATTESTTTESTTTESTTAAGSPRPLVACLALASTDSPWAQPSPSRLHGAEALATAFAALAGTRALTQEESSLALDAAGRIAHAVAIYRWELPRGGCTAAAERLDSSWHQLAPRRQGGSP
ncbi:MAG: hypothetical protein AAGD01_10445 [Acidobacteriota bacterium]